MQTPAAVQAQELFAHSGVALIDAPAAQTFESITNAILENERQIMALTELVSEQRADLISQITAAMRKLNITTKDIQAVLNDGDLEAEAENKPKRTRAPRGSRKLEESAQQQDVAATVVDAVAEQVSAPVVEEAAAVEASPAEQADVPAEAETSQEPEMQVAADADAGVDLSEVMAVLDGKPEARVDAVGEDDSEEEGVSLADAVHFDAPWANRARAQVEHVAR